MQSDGGLAAVDAFSGHKAILSGPAGGYVGYALTTRWQGASAAMQQQQQQQAEGAVNVRQTGDDDSKLEALQVCVKHVHGSIRTVQAAVNM